MSKRIDWTKRTHKVCNGCKESKPLCEYSWVGASYNGRSPRPQSRCKECCRLQSQRYHRLAGQEGWAVRRHRSRQEASRAGHLRRAYGMTLQQYQIMHDLQLGVCGMCEEPEPKGLRVDHDHDTATVRGLLCARCNTTLGQVDDDVQLLMAAALYINRHKQRKAA